MNEDAVACFKRLECCHSTQQVNKKVKKLQGDELHRTIQLVHHDHTYCSNKRNNPTQPALVVVETEREYGDTRKGIPCEVGKFVNSDIVYASIACSL